MGLSGLVPSYCALLDHKGFAELVVIVIRKIALLLKWDRTSSGLPYIWTNPKCPFTVNLNKRLIKFLTLPGGTKTYTFRNSRGGTVQTKLSRRSLQD